jgi:hypothetical protein
VGSLLPGALGLELVQQSVGDKQGQHDVEIGATAKAAARGRRKGEPVVGPYNTARQQIAQKRATRFEHGRSRCRQSRR